MPAQTGIQRIFPSPLEILPKRTIFIDKEPRLPPKQQSRASIPRVP